MKALTALALLAVSVVSTALLVSGSDRLGTVLPGGLPAGNALSALALVSLAAIPLVLGKPGSALRKVGRIVFMAAVAWLPVSIALAGNLFLNFSEWRGTVWLGFTATVHLAALALAVWALVGSMLAWWRQAKA